MGGGREKTGVLKYHVETSTEVIREVVIYENGKDFLTRNVG